MSIAAQDVVRILMRERDRLFAYIWAAVGDAHLAEDVFQEVSMLAAEKGIDVANEHALVIWIRRAARLKSLEAVRARTRRPTPLDDSVPTDTSVFCAYSLFFGGGFQSAGETWLKRPIDRFSFQGNRFNILAADRMVRVADGRGDHGSHPCVAANQVNAYLQSVPSGGLVWTESRWIGDYPQPNSGYAGIDMNFAYTDCSVGRIMNTLPFDSRMVGIPEFAAMLEYPVVQTFLPKP